MKILFLLFINTIFAQNLRQSIDKITSIYLKTEQNRIHFNKEESVLEIFTDENSNLINNSCFVVTIAIFHKNRNILSKNDSIYTFEGIDVKLNKIFNNHKSLFEDFKFKYIINSDLELSKFAHPKACVQFYFNRKGEITYITPNFDRIYFKILKNKIKFAKNLCLKKHYNIKTKK